MFSGNISRKKLKAYVLVILIISSVLLTGKIWFDEKLWPEGYNFFAVITDKFSFGNDDFVSSLTKETISFPKNLVVTSDDRRSVYAADSASFAAMVPDVKELLRLALESGEAVSVSAAEWSSALKNRSVHVVYPVAYDSRLFLSILGSYHADGAAMPVREFIITPESNAANRVNVYIRNDYTSELTRADVTWNRQRLEEMIDSYAQSSIGDLAYSSELNFDKSDGSGSQQKVLIESNVLIQLNKRLNNVLEEINPVYDGGEFNSYLMNSLLRQFDYNISGARKYTERDNSIVFVENYSTLKLHPNGLMEYKAVDNSKGIDLKSGNDFYQGLLGCVDFVNRIWGEVLPSRALNINISSDVIDTKTNAFRLTMDYFADGAEISISLPQSISHSAMNHAVEIEVVGGKIVSYRQVFACFDSGDMATDSVSAIDALDKLMADGNTEGQIIRDLYPVYISSDDSAYRTSAWAAKTADNRIVVIN